MFHVLTLIAAVAVPAIPAGTYTYHGSIGGAQSATFKVTVSAPDASSLAIAESTTGSYQGINATANAKLTLSATDFAPTAYTATYQGAGQSGTTTLAFANGQATENSPMGQRTFSLPNGVQHFTVLDGALLSGFIALPLEVRSWGANALFAIAPVYMQGAQLGIDATAPHRPTGVPASDAAINVTGQVPFVAWYDPATSLLDELDVPSQQITITRDK